MSIEPTPRPLPRFIVGDVIEGGGVVSAIHWQPDRGQYWVTTQQPDGTPHSGGLQSTFDGQYIVGHNDPEVADEPARVGDTVRMTVTRVIEGVAGFNSYGKLYVNGWAIVGPNRDVEVVTRAVAPLPDKPGTYWLDRDGHDVWQVSSEGILECFVSPSARASRYAPFVELVRKDGI